MNLQSIKGEEGEKFVHNLAQKSFLTDWCYLNPLLPNGKELCDLLVVYDYVAIIWQVKNLKLGKDGKYRKSEVEKNLRQIKGAQRQLFELKTNIYLKNPRRGKELFEANKIKEVFLVSVLLGEGEDSFSFLENIKDMTVHVFGQDFTTTILNELDTIGDFTEYLRRKEEFLTGHKSIIIMGGEEELLALYLMNEKKFRKFENADHLMLDDGCWGDFIKRPEYISKKQEDKISYGWDEIINRAHEGSINYEIIARELARPNRFERRVLSKAYLDAYIQANRIPQDMFRRVIQGRNATYCLLFFDDSKADRERRKAMLFAICWVARGKFKENDKVIGIATEKKARPECSYDFCFLNITEWTKEHQRKMEELQEKLEIFVNPKMVRIHEEEYPNIENREG